MRLTPVIISPPPPAPTLTMRTPPTSRLESYSAAARPDSLTVDTLTASNAPPPLPPPQAPPPLPPPRAISR